MEIGIEVALHDLSLTNWIARFSCLRIALKSQRGSIHGIAVWIGHADKGPGFAVVRGNVGFAILDIRIQFYTAIVICPILYSIDDYDGDFQAVLRIARLFNAFFGLL